MKEKISVRWEYVVFSHWREYEAFNFALLSLGTLLPKIKTVQRCLR